ncbi:MAG TPA: SDR family oxidoreductase [Candidatus Limnocylindrales bacterium]|nr:SDR family oxidoreductase [Candidatus Limnocylindrales bacterium]
MAITLKPIDQQVVVVVGCSSGIGRQTARRFAERGARLVLSGRDEQALHEVLEDVHSLGAEDAIAVQADVADPAALEEVARRAREAFGRVDTWVQGAAVSVYATAEETTPDEFRRVIEVNLLGQIHGALAALPALREAGGGALIEISSVEAEVGLPYQSAYAASKHGMAGFLRSLRMELQAEGAPIAVTQVMPAGIDTPLFMNARSKLGVLPKPTAPVYDPDVVADQVLWAAQHPSGDLFAGGAGWGVALVRRLSPGGYEALMARVGKAAQRSRIPEGPDAVDNLEAPTPLTDTVRGGFGGRRFSLSNRIQRVPGVVRAAAVAAAVAGVMLLRRRLAA